MTKEIVSDDQSVREKLAAAAEDFARRVWEYVQVVGWLAQMDPTYPHTEFHPYEAAGPAPEPSVV